MLFAFDFLSERNGLATVAALVVFLLAYEAWLLTNNSRQRSGEPPLKIRFSIRDLFWLTLVAALAVGWWIDHEKLKPKMMLVAPGRRIVVEEQSWVR